MKNNDGFTLIELLAVISVLAILMIIAIPNIIKVYGSAKKDNFLNEVKTMLVGAETAYLSETITHNKKINIVASDESFVEIANANLKEGEAQKISGKMDYDSKTIDYYIELDSKGKPTKYIFSNGSMAIFSIKGKQELDTTDIIEEKISVSDYVKEFNISGPIISTGNTYTKEALDFDFKASDLIGKGPNGTNLNTWTSKSGDVSGTIYRYSSGTITPIANPTFNGNALVLHGREAIRFNAEFNYDDTNPNNPDSYGSFTLEATVKFSEFSPIEGNYTNLISNIESGGYYLNVNSESQGATIGYPGLSVFFEQTGYLHCSMEESINVNELHVITGKFELKKNKVTLYLDGKYKKTCDYDDTLKFRYPTVDVPLSVGGNPAPDSAGYFTDREWVYGEIYTARIYKGVMSDKEIYMNYLSNYIYANNLSQNSSVINLSSIDETIPIQKYQYSLDNGKTWIDYDFTAVPLITENTLVSARTISNLGVVSPVTTVWVYVE